MPILHLLCLFPLVLRVFYLILIEIISFLESRDYVSEDHHAKVQEGQKGTLPDTFRSLHHVGLIVIDM